MKQSVFDTTRKKDALERIAFDTSETRPREMRAVFATS